MYWQILQKERRNCRIVAFRQSSETKGNPAVSLGDPDYMPQTSAPGRDGFMSEVEGFLHDFGLHQFSYAAFGSAAAEAAGQPGTFVWKGNYNADWTVRYQGLHYDQIDPVVQVAKSSRAPFLWGGGTFLKRFRKRQKLVFHEANEFGIAHGLSIPINGRNGLELVTYTTDDRNAIRQAFSDHGGKLIVAAYNIADALNAMEPGPESEEMPLTPRERESLIWVADGLTSQEIAEKMSISASAVNYHLNNAGQKLSARNRHHAALLALKKQWI